MNRSPSTPAESPREHNWLGAHVRKRRQELELSQEQVAERTELPLPTIAQLERGSRTPSVATLERILGALGEELQVGSRPSPRASSAS
jgi:transcriptional regulator with XRE-family HTH domain